MAFCRQTRPLRYRLKVVREPAAVPIGDVILAPRDLWKAAMRILDGEAQEVLVAFHLDRRHRIRGYHEVTRGSIHETAVDPRLLFGAILLTGAPAFALVHNHPSGDPSPSVDDHRATTTIARLADLFDLEFLDHLVAGDAGFVSLRASG